MTGRCSGWEAARNFRSFLAAVAGAFDVCVIDTNPNPDIRVIAALASADFVLSPTWQKQEAMDGVSGLLNHERVGLRKIKAVLNSKLVLIDLLLTLVEPTPFQKANFLQLVPAHLGEAEPSGAGAMDAQLWRAARVEDDRHGRDPGPSSTPRRTATTK